MPGVDLSSPSDPTPASQESLSETDLTENNLKTLESPSPLSQSELPQTKDSPLTDIGTSPPPFELPSLGARRAHSRDSYESSELSDLGDDDSEAETDRMDFLNEESGSKMDERVSDLQRLSELTDLADLPDLDSLRSQDSENEFAPDISSGSHSISSDSFSADQNGSESIGDSLHSLKRPRESAAEAFAQIAEKEEAADKAEKESMKRRRLSDSAAIEDTIDDTIYGGIESESSMTKSIFQNGSEPLSRFTDESTVTAIAPVESLISPTEQSSTDEFDEEGSLSDIDEPRLKAVVEEGAPVNIDDVAKQQPNEDNDDEDEDEREEDEDEREEDEDEREDDDEDEREDDEDEREDDDDEEEEEVGDDEIEEEAKMEALEESSSKIANEREVSSPAEVVDLEEQRKSAIEELISIENDFSFLRDKLYQDKLRLLEHEMQLCLEGSHPELLQIYFKVNEFYQDNIRLADATLNYSLKCINRETIASRTSIHQDFMKNLSNTRNTMITDTTSSWYKINKEWNYLDSVVPDYNFAAIPSTASQSSYMPLVAGGSSAEYYQDNIATNKKLQKQNTIIELVHRRNCVNAQLGILDGLKEFHGIPSAVSNSLLDDNEFDVDELLLRKASPDEIKEDLQAMGILR